MSSFGKRTVPPQDPSPGYTLSRPAKNQTNPPVQSPAKGAKTQAPCQENSLTDTVETPIAERPVETVKTGKEPRVSPRTRVFKGAVISYDDRNFTIACTVRNISDTGARLQILQQLMVPDTFVLLIELDSVETDCVVVWRKGDAVGVKFQSSLYPVKRSREQVVSASNEARNSPLRKHPVR